MRWARDDALASGDRINGGRVYLLVERRIGTRKLRRTSVPRPPTGRAKLFFFLFAAFGASLLSLRFRLVHGLAGFGDALGAGFGALLALLVEFFLST